MKSLNLDEKGRKQAEVFANNRGNLEQLIGKHVLSVVNANTELTLESLIASLETVEQGSIPHIYLTSLNAIDLLKGSKTN